MPDPGSPWERENPADGRGYINPWKGNEMPFDPTKPVQTRNGRKARILCTDRKDRKGGMPIVALYESDEGIETQRNYNMDGTANGGIYPDLDLVNIPERDVLFITMVTKQVLDGDLTNFRGELKDNFKRSICEEKFSTLKLTFEDGKLVSSEVVR